MSIALDISVQFAWAIANTEAYLARDSRIRPIHFLLGILKVIDPAFPQQVAHLSIPQDHLSRLERTAQAARHYLEMSPEDIITFRRRLRRTVRSKEHAPVVGDSICTLHRSDLSRALFASLAHRTSKNRQSEITALSLLEELVMSEVIDLEALWQLVVKGKETASGNAPRTWSTGRGWRIVDEGGEQSNITPDLPSVLDGHGRNLSQLAKVGQLLPVLGRTREITSVLRFLHRKKKQSVLLIGAPGIGKTSIIEALAQNLCCSGAPDCLQNITIIQITAGEVLLALTAEGGDSTSVRTRLDDLISLSNLILAIEDLDRLFKPEAKHANAAELLRNAIARNHLRILGTATDRGYDSMRSTHDSFADSLNLLHVDVISVEDCKAIAQQWAEAIAGYHNVQFAFGTVDYAVEVASRNIQDGVMPATVIDLLENAAVRCKVSVFSSNTKPPSQALSLVSKQTVQEVVREQYGIDLEELKQSE